MMTDKFAGVAEQKIRKDAMIVEYRDKTKKSARVLIVILLVPFTVFLAFVFSSFFGLFGQGAFELVRSVLQGDLTRICDFAGYVALLLIAIGIPTAMGIATVRNAVMAPDQTIKIDSDRRLISIHFDVPWIKTHSAEYPFDDVEAIELKNSFETLSETHEIWLRVPDRKKPLILMAVFDSSDAYQEFQKLKEMGLPAQ